MKRKTQMDTFGAVALTLFALNLAFNQVVVKVTAGGCEPIFGAGVRSGFYGACGTEAGGQRAGGTARGPPVMLSAACTATNAAVLVQAHARMQRAHTPEQVHLD